MNWQSILQATSSESFQRLCGIKCAASISNGKRKNTPINSQTKNEDMTAHRSSRPRFFIALCITSLHRTQLNQPIRALCAPPRSHKKRSLNTSTGPVFGSARSAAVENWAVRAEQKAIRFVSPPGKAPPQVRSRHEESGGRHAAWKFCRPPVSFAYFAREQSRSSVRRRTKHSLAADCSAVVCRQPSNTHSFSHT